MNNVLTIVFSVVLVVLAIIMSVVGVQLLLVLIQFRKTLKSINRTLHDAEQKFNQVVEPLQNLGGIAAGIKTGAKVFDTFVSWLNSRKKKQDKSQDELES
jgi:hypothetical protein